MTKTYNNLTNYAKKLLIEANPSIDKDDIIITNHSNIDNVFRKLRKENMACIDYVGTEELPLIYHSVYMSSSDKDTYHLDEDSMHESLIQGIIQYTCEDFTIIVLRATNAEEDVEKTDFKFYAFTKEMFSRAYELAYDDSESEIEVPGKGIYRAFTQQTMAGSFIKYAEIEEVPSFSAIHQNKEEILKSTKFFFENISLFSRFGQKPLRKFLLCGEPGTGKTSICYDIAKEYSKDIPIVFVTDFETMARHISKCAKVNQRTVVIFEDCEADLRRSNTDSSILNFLDGIDRPNIQDGAIVIMTTNHPERIEARITKRPGRIDKLFFIDALQGKSAVEVFNLYFGEFMKENNFDYTTQTAKEAIEIIASGMTGAQIKELFNSYVCYMVSEAKEFSLNDVFNTKEELFKSFHDMDDKYTSIEAKEEFEITRGKLLSVLNR